MHTDPSAPDELDGGWDVREPGVREPGVREPGVREPVALEPSGVPIRAQVAVQEPPAPFGWTDGLTDLDGPRLWDRLLAAEQARNARHKRRSTIVFVEVVGFETAVARWGITLALQLFVEVGRLLARGVRESDHLARIRATRFAILLPETDEISAINFVDRVQGACRRELDPARNGLRLVMGWASPDVGGDLKAVTAVAEERLAEALRQEA